MTLSVLIVSKHPCCGAHHGQELGLGPILHTWTCRVGLGLEVGMLSPFCPASLGRRKNLYCSPPPYSLLVSPLIVVRLHVSSLPCAWPGHQRPWCEVCVLSCSPPPPWTPASPVCICTRSYRHTQPSLTCNHSLSRLHTPALDSCTDTMIACAHAQA